MPRKEYRICAATTPSDLDNQVNALVTDGWELYGHPFPGPSTEPFCQAVVRGVSLAPLVATNGLRPTPPIAKPKAAPTPIPARPPRPFVPVTFRKLATFAAALIGAYLFLDTAIFRSGLYARFLEPDGATGSVERMFDWESRWKPNGKKNVLVVGNSRMAEGFSAKLANESRPEDGFVFHNYGMPGTGDRVWYYMVRDIDPHRDRYDAITIPIDDFADPDDYEDVADRVGEYHLLLNRLRLTDIVPYAMSFTSWKSRFEVFRATLLPAVGYQRDILDFLEHPQRRLERVRAIRERGEIDAYAYGGMEKSLAGFHVDYAAKHMDFPDAMPQKQREDLEGTFFRNPPQDGHIRAYEVRWLGALVDLYKGSKTRIIVFQAPRSPAPRPVPLSHWDWTAVDDLKKRPWVKVLDHQTFEGLEKGELFADHVHLNAEGRKIFSPMLAESVKEVLRQ